MINTSRLLEAAKAFAGAAVTAAAAAYTTAAAKGQITSSDWAYIVGAGVVGGLLVFLVPNKAAPATK